MPFTQASNRRLRPAHVIWPAVPTTRFRQHPVHTPQTIPQPLEKLTGHNSENYWRPIAATRVFLDAAVATLNIYRFVLSVAAPCVDAWLVCGGPVLAMAAVCCHVGASEAGLSMSVCVVPVFGGGVVVVPGTWLAHCLPRNLRCAVSKCMLATMVAIWSWLA